MLAGLLRGAGRGALACAPRRATPARAFSTDFSFNESLLAQLKVMDARLTEVSEGLASGVTLSPGSDAPLGKTERVKLSREMNRLEAIMYRGKQVEPLRAELADLRSLITGDGGGGGGGGAEGADGGDEDEEEEEEMRELAAAELKELEVSAASLEHELKLTLLPVDEADDGDAIIEVRAGAGGDEASLFASDVFGMYQKACALRGLRFEQISRSDTECGGCKEASAAVSGAGAFGALKYESGVHRVQRVPATERQGRLHTSAVSVAVMVAVEEAEYEFNTSDLRIDLYRASGAGGQHVNCTESAVRITHLPTGTSIAMQDERSQHKNKEKAMKLLRARVADADRLAKAQDHQEQRSALLGTGGRSERIRTYNFKEDRVSDHRIGETKFGIEAMLRGELLEEFLEELAKKDQETRLEELSW
jgi:peptide chain release factor 1